MRAWLCRLGAALLLAALVGCATPLPQVERTPSRMLVAPPEAPLARAVTAVPPGRSGFWPLPQAEFALDARLALIRQARTSLDLQYYLIGNDSVGHAVLRELRNAAQRGVRVRLLVDDLYTRGLDRLLVDLQAHPNIEVRLFNPFVGGREFALGRFVGIVGDFRRLNHRMHNKLLVADGTWALVGGRNLADEYFLRSRDANFIDMDMLAGGALVGQLGELFDAYWNSEQVFPLAAIAGGTEPALAQRQFEHLTVAADAAEWRAPPDGADIYGAPPLSTALAAGSPRLVVADGSAYADTPAKARADGSGFVFEQTATYRFVTALEQAHSEIIVISPYFIPGPKGLARLKAARDAGIEVRVITNAMGTSDEPLVNLGYERYRNAMLSMGIQLYELSQQRLVRDPTIRRVLGSARGRLHAKLAFVDRRTAIVGSMNADLRSAYTNTEIGVAIESPELVKMMLDAYRIGQDTAGVYEVQLRPDGSGVQWIGRDAQGEEHLLDEPEVGAWQRLRLWFMFLFVSEDLL
jgi:putative cardiolipin synthase